MSLARKVRYPLLRLVSAFKDIDPTDNYLIFSEPRGGSTWLTEMIHRVGGTAIIWEPLSARVYPELARMKVGIRQYVPESARWPELERFLDEVLRGRNVRYNSGSMTGPLELLGARRLIVKFCRANALLPWFVRVLPVKKAPIYLLRHPFAVVASQLRHGAWNRESARFRMPDGPFREYHEAHAEFLSGLATLEETLTARWCLANKPALDSPEAADGWMTLYYERLMANPLGELTRVFDAWGTTMPPGIADAARAPSRTVRDATDLDDDRAQLAKWRRALDPEAQRRMQAVLTYFGIRRYSMESVHPMETTS